MRNDIIKYCTKLKLSKEQIAYIIATAEHESNDYKNLIESLNYSVNTARKTFGKRLDNITNEQLFKAILNKKDFAELIYGGEWGKAKLGNDKKGDAYKYIGRGLVMITGKANYKRFDDFLGLKGEMVKYPDIAKKPEISIRILVDGMIFGMFTGYKLTNFINNFQVDYFNARKIINGLDCAEKIKQEAINICGQL